MNNIKILDCTLRDGGYINNWLFGAENIVSIINALDNSGADFIECGFLTEESSVINVSDVSTVSFEQYGSSLYNSFEHINKILPDCTNKEKIAAMISYGKFPEEKIPQYSADCIKNLRIIFKKRDMLPALKYCKKIIKKGYNIFVNPTFLYSYNKCEMKELLKKVNEINPYVFSVVDSTGALDSSGLKNILNLLDENLDLNIIRGFHFHNNLENAFLNVEMLLKNIKDNNCIIDSSLFGMGRGAGNLQTELLMHFINETYPGAYKPSVLLSVINNIIKPLYEKSPWISSVYYALAALHNCHPNYAKFLAQKGLIDIEKVNKIFQAIEHEKIDSYEEKIIEKLWQKFK